MASRQNDFYNRMIGDTALTTTLTGGIFKSEDVGIEGISRTTTPSAFDALGEYLKPCALVTQRSLVPTGDVLDYGTQVISARQVVEIFLYADSGAGFTAIDTAIARLKVLFMGYVFAGTFEVTLANLIDRARDEGALQGSAMAKMDWQVDSIM